MYMSVFSTTVRYKIIVPLVYLRRIAQKHGNIDEKVPTVNL